MAVQKSRKTPSRRGMRRSHDALSSTTLYQLTQPRCELSPSHHAHYARWFLSWQAMLFEVGQKRKKDDGRLSSNGSRDTSALSLVSHEDCAWNETRHWPEQVT
ncbi:UNVERIFIED_CONTAM: hypothetical protein GTU68_044242 [Idotea baltica]|nr:hypothetical protein [Idotea baltica]